MLRHSPISFVRAASSSSSIKNPKSLTHLRTLFGYYHSKPAEFKGSPAFPFGANHHVRYESLDVDDVENIKKASKLAASSSFSSSSIPSKRHLHRIHHIGGFISSLYVVEYRTYHPLHPSLVIETGQHKNDEHHNYERELFLLDCGIPSDITRIEVALRHVFHDDYLLHHHDKKEETTTNKNQKHQTHQPISHRCKSVPLTRQCYDFISDKMKLVFATHAHVDHLGSSHEWISRGVPVATVPNMEDHWNGLMGKIQWTVEVLGSNVYGFYLNRKFPEFTWVNPFKTIPQISKTPELFSEKLRQLIPNNRLIGGNSVPIFDDWLILQVPGHTHHMGILYHPESKMIYVADMFLHQFGKFRPPIPVDRLDCYLQSLDMIKNLPVKWVLLAHGGIMKIREEGEPLNQELIAAEERRREKKLKKEQERKEMKKNSNANKSKEKSESTYSNDERVAIKLAMENERNDTFKEICESVAARAIKTAKQENANKTSFIVKMSRFFANCSNAPKEFDWDRDMISAKEQMEILNRKKDKILGRNSSKKNVENGGVVVNFGKMKHVRDYTNESRPRD